MNTKKCTKCKKPQALEMFAVDNRRKDGRKSQCQMCVSAYNRKIYLERFEPKVKPVLLSWQPKPGERLRACLVVDQSDWAPKGRVWCELNPFVCESNEVSVVIATSLDSRWRLDKSDYYFVRPN